MLGADNIIDITFGVTSVILTMITIYLMCKNQKSRVPELDIEQGRDLKLNPIIPNPDPVSTPSYFDLRSLPTLNQAVVPFPVAPHPDISPSTPSYQTASEITLARHQIPEQNVQSFPITTDIATVPDIPGSHTYYHSLHSFFLNESG
ncbi:uncharacterized protein EAE97_008110 [Botrytis byssoidea]|uniref:Uncharacterized protein n=1 Tax=Botrytis byssoidea TaxID=139641 RepID=A0A9P5IB87_9HELO|nr:uncharacterized protein EAE97_008110 [Botrytis byssoidea]KAF7935203.1 hypothetical protein EAE97_008110 [Botrytis byssoidea]